MVRLATAVAPKLHCGMQCTCCSSPLADWLAGWLLSPAAAITPRRWLPTRRVPGATLRASTRLQEQCRDAGSMWGPECISRWLWRQQQHRVERDALNEPQRRLIAAVVGVRAVRSRRRCRRCCPRRLLYTDRTYSHAAHVMGDAKLCEGADCCRGTQDALSVQWADLRMLLCRGEVAESCCRAAACRRPEAVYKAMLMKYMALENALSTLGSLLMQHQQFNTTSRATCLTGVYIVVGGAQCSWKALSQIFHDCCRLGGGTSRASTAANARTAASPTSMSNTSRPAVDGCRS